jgi:hypothetical protein
MRAKLFLGCVVLSLAAAIAYCQAPGEPAGKDPTYPKKGNKGGGPGMRPTLARPQWEYTVRSTNDFIDRGKPDFDAGLNRLGAEGWELVAVDPASRFIFKRPTAPFAGPRGVGGPGNIRTGGFVPPAQSGFAAGASRSGGGKSGDGPGGSMTPPAPLPEFQIVSLKYTPVEHAARILQQCFTDVRGVRSGPRVVADDRTNSLLLAGSDEQLTAVRRLIQVLDVEGAELEPRTQPQRFRKKSSPSK